MLSVLWVIFIAASMLFGSYKGEGAAVAAAGLEGASAAIELCIGLAGAMCLWSAVIALMEASGLSGALGKLLSPALKRLFPVSFKVPELRDSITTNVTANMLGLGNAATPAGLAATEGMARLGRRAESEIRRFVVINTASIQLLPTTVAAVRAACGAKDAFDILPAVWITSVLALSAGLIACHFSAKAWCER